jgi:hypothetical protein
MSLSGTINTVPTLSPRQLSSPYHNPPVHYPCSMPHTAGFLRQKGHITRSEDKISNGHTIIVFFSYISGGAAKENVICNG